MEICPKEEKFTDYESHEYYLQYHVHYNKALNYYNRKKFRKAKVEYRNAYNCLDSLAHSIIKRDARLFQLRAQLLFIIDDIADESDTGNDTDECIIADENDNKDNSSNKISNEVPASVAEITSTDTLTSFHTEDNATSNNLQVPQPDDKH